VLITYTKVGYTKSSAIVVADLHINSKLSIEFERNRLQALCSSFPPLTDQDLLVLAGDTFDKNIPSYQDLLLFYEFIQAINTANIFIINGNHDSSIFEFIPEYGFTYVPECLVINDEFMLVSYTALGSLIAHLQSTSYPNLTLISHARCTIEPYIVEEVPIKVLSEGFKEVLLGDIHTQPVLPYHNVMYTTSPSNVSFTAYQKGAHGYLRLFEGNTKFIPIELPTKKLLTYDTVEEVVAFLTKPIGADRHYYKVRFKGTAEELRTLSKLTKANTIKDFSVASSIISEEEPEEVVKLSEFLSSKASLSVFAFTYFSNTLQIKEGYLEEIRQDYEKYRTEKGGHR